MKDKIIKIFCEHIDYNLNEARGEFWIDSSGNVESCDIDVNDTGHEGVVLEKLMYEYTNIFDIDYERHPREDLGKYDNEIKGFLKENGLISSPEEEEAFDDDAAGYTWDRYLKGLEWVQKDPNKVRDALGLIWGLGGGMKDARDYAMKYFGDKRLVGNSVQTWDLTERDLKIIGDGIYEANGDEMEGSEETFSIEVMNPKNRMMFWEVPWEVINEGNISGLMSYKERQIAESPMFHGTNVKFDKPKDGMIHWLTPDADFAKSYSQGAVVHRGGGEPIVYDYDIEVTHPALVEDDFISITKLLSKWYEKRPNKDVNKELVVSKMNEIRNKWCEIGLDLGTIQTFNHWNISGKWNILLIEYLELLGYNGIYYKEDGHDTYGVWNI